MSANSEKFCWGKVAVMAGTMNPVVSATSRVDDRVEAIVANDRSRFQS